MNRVLKSLTTAARNAAALGLLLYTVAGHAADTVQSSMRFDRLGIEQGLSQSAVMDVVQDSSGFLWFATESGLDRYDGYGFHPYRHRRGDADSLGNNFVRDLEVDSSGGVWAATDGGGISLWRSDTDTFQTWRHDPNDPNSIASDRIRRILADGNGNLWIATRESGLDRLHVETGTVTHFRHAADDTQSLSSDQVYALALGGDEQLWVGTLEGLNRIDMTGGAVQRFDVESETFGAFAKTHVRSLLVSQAGDLWIGTNDRGLHLHVPGRRVAVAYQHDQSDPQSVASDRIEALYEDASSRLWVGTDRGLSLLDRETRRFSHYKNARNDLNSLSDDFVFTIFQDRGGILWVGTRSGGANKWNPKSWLFGHNRFTSDNDLPSSSHVTAFTVDRVGRSWIGTFGGGIKVISADRSQVDQLRHSEQDEGTLSDNRVMTLLQTRDGTIWAGTMRGGLNRIDPATYEVTVYQHSDDDTNSLAANGVMSLHEDRSGRLWVGTFGGGVSRLRPATDDFVSFRNSDDPLSLSNNRATAVVEDQDGAIWVGTDGGGLNRSTDDGHTWQHFEHDNDQPESLSADTIYSLHATRSRAVWVGTRSGLDRVHLPERDGGAPRIENIQTGNELGGRAIYSLTSDSDSRIWMGTERGLLSIDSNSLTVREFHSEHGLQGDEFNFGAAYSAPTGELFFGGSNGFNRFDPRSLRFDKPPAPIHLTSFEIWNKEVAMDSPYELLDQIELGYRDDSVSFEFAVMDFESPDRARYLHQLVGFDEDWVDSGANRRVFYTNLSGGDYELRVRATNADQDWTSAELHIPIRVAPAPWQTWWAYALYALLFAAIVLAIHMQQGHKLRQEAQLNRRLEREVEARTRELHAKNQDLSEANEKLETLSTTDALTGLHNRRYLFEKVAKDVELVLRRQHDLAQNTDPRETSDLSFLMVDLDNFKPINDTLGHEAGDALILKICDVLTNCCRSSDDIIRWGGDEFLIVARDTNSSYAANLAERIRSALAQRVFFVSDENTAKLTASIGYASYPFFKEQPDLMLWEDVLSIADTAMYEAKKNKNSWIGIEGVRWTADGQTLYSQIRDNPDDLVKKGIIRWITRVEDAEVSTG